MKSKQLFLNMIATILAFLVNTGISFFLTPFITKQLGEEAYGFISLANNFVIYASLVTIALNSMAGRFITIKIHQEKYEEANKYFTSILIANIFFTLILIVPSAFIVFFLDNLLNISPELILDVKILFALIFINFFLSIINATYSTATFVRNRLDLSSKVNIISYVLRAGLLLGIFALLKPIIKPRVSYVGMVSCIVSIYVLIMNIYYTRKLMSEVKVHKKYFDLKKIFEIIKSGIWNTITKLGQIFSDGLDLLVTNLFINPQAMGQFAIVKTITTCLSSFISTFAGIFSPQQTIDYAKGDIDVVVDDLKFSMKLTSFMSNMPYAFFVVFGFTFYRLWVPEVDTNILNTLSLLSIISQLTLSSIVPLWQIFTITNKLKVNSLVTVGTGFLNILIVFILLKYTNLGVIAIAGVSSVTAMIKNITYTPMYSAHCLEVSKKTFYPEIFRNLFVTTLLLISYFIVYQLLPVNSWLALFLAVFICGILGCIINYIFLFSNEDRQEFKAIAKKIIKKMSWLENIIWNMRVYFRNIYWFIYRFKKIDNNKIIFDNFNGNGFGDNPKYIAMELLQNNPSYDLVWCLNEINYNKEEIIPNNIRKVLIGSKEWIYENCTAKVWVDNVRKTYFYKKRKGQIYIQTWHGGFGVKQIEKDTESTLDSRYVKKAKLDSKNIDLLLSDSKWKTELFQRCFWYIGEIGEFGLPRNDILFDEFQKIKIAKKYNKKFNIKEDTIKILYAPTFRKNLGIDAYRLNFDKIIKAFEKKFNKKTVILIKLHPNVLHLKDQFEYSNNVIDANNVTDTQELEIYADMIISDYSSMLFEFLLMNKPGFIYANDFEEYMKERQLYFDLSKLPFPFAIFEDEFIQNIKTFDEEAYIEKVNDFKDQQKPICDGKASKKVVQWLKEKMEEGNADDAQKNSKHN